MIKLKALLMEKEEKETYRLYREGKIEFVTTNLNDWGDFKLSMFMDNVCMGYTVLQTEIPIKDLGNINWPKPNFLFVDDIKVFDKSKGYGYILYRHALEFARSQKKQGLCSAKNHRTGDADYMWRNFKSYDDKCWDYADIKDLGNRIKEQLSESTLQELKVTKLNKDEEDIYFIAYKEHLFLLDKHSNYKSLESYFKDHPQFKNQTRNIFDNDWYDFISELAESAPDIMVGQYDPIQKILTLDSRGHFNARSSLMLKKVVKQLGIKKVDSDVLNYEGDSTRISYNKNKILGDVPTVVYHGTTSNHLEDILISGLEAGKGRSKFAKQDIYHETEIFFGATFNECEYYAFNAKNQSGGVPIIFEFTIPDKALLKPDYDADTASTSRSNYYSNQPTSKYISKSDMKPMGLSRETGKWGYSGIIRPNFIRWIYLYREHDKKWIKLRPLTIKKILDKHGIDGLCECSQGLKTLCFYAKLL